MIGSELILVQEPTSFLDTTKKLVAQPLIGLNQHMTRVTVSDAATLSTYLF